MTLPIFPSLPGLTWPLTRSTIAGSNLVFKASSGAVAAAQLWSAPLYEWELSYEGLDSLGRHPGLIAHSKQLLESFFLTVGGRASPFLYVDPSDTQAQGSVLGTGDGATVVFTGRRTIGTYASTVDAILNVAAVYLNGVAQDSSTWALSAPNGVDVNAITLTTAPAAGVVVTADFWYAFKVRFVADDFAFKQLTPSLWQCEGVKFRRERE